MPEHKKIKIVDKTEGILKLNVPTSQEFSVSPTTDQLREQTRSQLANYVLVGLFGILFTLALGLFLLIILDKPQSSVFKDILLSFIGFASGVLVSIFSFYYKENNN